MPDKLTDAEIVKAMTCYINHQDCDECKYCIDDYFCNKAQICIDALDLINRLQARVEKSEKVEHFADKTIATLQAENERLKLEIKEIMYLPLPFKTQFDKAIDTAKAEAYKEFVNKIKVHAYYIDFPKEHRVVDEDDIDNLLKELVGEDK